MRYSTRTHALFNNNNNNIYLKSSVQIATSSVGDDMRNTST